MKTIFYIDGFNLYYGITARGKVVLSKKNPKIKFPLQIGKYKWLNIEKLCSILAKDDEILKIKYFTADIIGEKEPTDRQKLYLRVLSELPKVEIIKGKFLTSTPLMKLVNPPQEKAYVIKLEEKGTDVNIASHMLIDAFNDCYEKAILISNDSDLAFPTKYIRDVLKKPVVIFNPQRRPSHDLKISSTAIKPIYNNALKASQFVDEIVLSNGEVCKRPDTWK